MTSATARGDDRVLRAPIRAQGLYYTVTGVWPVVHMRSFIALTGDKRERWLVQTFGILTAAIGYSLLRGTPTRATARLGWSAAAAIGVPDVAYWARGTLPLPCLLDGVAQLCFAAAALVAYRRARS
jgi:hypothetical protein